MESVQLWFKTFFGPLKPSFHSKLEASVSEFLVERYGLRSFAAWQKTDKQKQTAAETMMNFSLEPWIPG